MGTRESASRPRLEEKNSADMSVATYPGASAFTRTPRGASSIAMTSVSRISPAFAAT